MTNDDHNHAPINTTNSSTQPHTCTTSSTQPGHTAKTTASFHAALHKNVVETDLAQTAPDGFARDLITACAGRELAIYEVDVPASEAEREALTVDFAAKLRHQRVGAAGATVKQGTADDHRVVVLALDRDGGREAWEAQVVRRDGRPPTITEWRRAEVGGPVMFMLHLAVGNDAMLREHAEQYGVPQEFVDPVETLERGEGDAAR